MILAISHHAGGVGKTHLALNLGYQLARAGKRVLLVDLDPQGDLSRRLNVPPQAPTLADALATGTTHARAVAGHWNGTALAILPADQNMAGVEPRILGKVGAEQRLRRLLTTGGAAAANYILIDCAPSLSLLTMNAWYAADGLLIPVQGEDKAYMALSLLVSTLTEVNQYRQPPLPVFGLVATKVNTRESMGPEIVTRLQARYPETFKTFIPDRASARYEMRQHAPVSFYEPRGDVATAYANLAQEVISRAENTTALAG